MFRFHRMSFGQKAAPLFSVVMALLLSFCLTAVALAQEETAEPTESVESAEQPPVLKLLALVPDTIEFSGGSFIGFSDFNAAIATRAGAVDYNSWDEFQADLDADSEAASLALQSLPLSGFPNASYLMTAGPEMPTLLGFDFFDLDTALTYGQPPNQVYLYQGDFDADQIDAALTSNGYVSDTVGEGELPYWCPEAGCDTGMMQDIQNRNPANLFGGDLGRHFPVVLADDVIAASPDNTEVEAVADTYDGTTRSVADDPDFQTAVAAMYGGLPTGDTDDQPLLRQAYFIPADAVGSFNDPAVMLNMTQEQIEQLRERLLTEAPDPLPVYSLMSLGDFGNSTQQYAQVVIVYDDEADAQTAAEIVPQRLETMTSMQVARPFQDILNDRDMELLEPVIYADEATGQYATVFTFEYPQATSGEQIQTSGIGYQLFLNMVFTRDMLWLASDMALPEVE